MKIAALILFLTISSVSFAQPWLKGEVVLINSNNAPLPGVELVVENAVPTFSDANGKFRLELQKDGEGKIVLFQRISRKGYEVVNSKDIESWIASPELIYKIVMCKKGYLEESKMKYYNAGNLLYRKRYENAISELNKLIKTNEISQIQYIEKFKEAKNEYDQSKRLLNYYADKFARINRDELKGIDSLAMSCFDTGDIEGAIKIYENASMIEKFEKYIGDRTQVTDNMNTLLPSIISQIKLYLLSEDSLLAKKASLFIQQLLIIYPNNRELLELKDKLRKNE